MSDETYACPECGEESDQPIRDGFCEDCHDDAEEHHLGLARCRDRGQMDDSDPRKPMPASID